MRIIKITHAETNDQIDHEKQSFAIQTYNLDAFLERTEKKETIPYLITNFAFTPPNIRENMIKKKIRDKCLAVVKDIAMHLEDIETISLAAARNKYAKTDNLSIGTYTLHPYDSARLTRLENYHTNLAMEKDDELILLLGKMGANTIRIIEHTSEEKSSSGKLDTIKLESQIGVSKKLDSGKELIVSFEGNNVNIDADLLTSSLWFSNDSRLRSIFESRRFNPNKMKQYTLRSTYTETFDFDFIFAAKFLTLKTDLIAQYQSLSRKERFFHVDFK